MSHTRRAFLKTTSRIPVAAAGLLAGASAVVADDKKSGMLHEGLAIASRRGVQEVTTVNAPGGEYWMFLGEKKRLLRKESRDGGRTWSKPVPQTTAGGDAIPLARDNPHLTFLTLKSGRLAIVYGGPVARPGRDGTTLFRTSDDGGKTWSKPTAVDALFAVCRTQAARVLSSGRIVVPVMKWISPFIGGDSEGANKNLTYSWVYYSDDEGKSWKRSFSELFVALDEGRRGVTHFEETVLEELPDGRLFMLGRTELGQFYKTYSSDQGVSWKHPVPTGLASSYAPGTLIRVPGTSDMMLVWNQASEKEILSGLHRHRLSTAISRDHGETWTHFRNLESLDDRARIAAPKGRPRVIRMTNYGYRSPSKKDYPRVPGCMRICYATVAFSKQEVAVTYDYGYGPGEFEKKSATKIKVFTRDWLYGRA